MKLEPRQQLKLGVTAALVALIVAFPIWWRSPRAIIWRYSILEQKGEEGEANGQRMREELVACGTKAVPVIIREVRNGWMHRGGAYYPSTLARLGKPAHEALLRAIDREADPLAREDLVAALVSGFQDLSRIELVLTNARYLPNPEISLRRLESEIRRAAPNAPELMLGNEVNPQILAWLRTNSSGKNP